MWYHDQWTHKQTIKQTNKTENTENIWRNVFYLLARVTLTDHPIFNKVWSNSTKLHEIIQCNLWQICDERTYLMRSLAITHNIKQVNENRIQYMRDNVHVAPNQEPQTHDATFHFNMNLFTWRKKWLSDTRNHNP